MIPIFVGGPGRSGTTVVKDCLAQHSEIHTLGDVEPRVIVSPGGLLDLLNTFIADWDPWRGDEALHRFVQLCMSVDSNHGDRLRAWAMRTLVIGRTNASRSDTGRSVMLETAPLGDRAADVARAGLVACFGTDAHAVVDDTPYSCCVTGLIDSVYPGSVTVGVVRHPADILSSMQRKRWAPDDWELCATRIFHTLGKCSQCDYLIVLEKLVRNPSMLGDLLALVGLEYDPACAGPLNPSKLHERRRDSLPRAAWVAYEKVGLKQLADELGY